MGSSQGANGYAYVWNNPLTRWDPTGYKGEEIDTRNECNPDCPQNWRDGVGARLSNTYVSCFGRCDGSAGYDNTGFRGYWVDGQQTGAASFQPDGNVESVVISAPRSVWVPFGGLDGVGAGGFGSAAIGTFGNSGQVVGGATAEALTSERYQSPLSDVTGSLDTAYGAIGLFVESFTKNRLDLKLIGTLGNLASGADIAVSVYQQDYKRAAIGVAFLSAQTGAVIFGAPWIVTTGIAVAAVSFGVGQVIGSD